MQVYTSKRADETIRIKSYFTINTKYGSFYQTDVYRAPSSYSVVKMEEFLIKFFHPEDSDRSDWNIDLAKMISTVLNERDSTSRSVTRNVLYRQHMKTINAMISHFITKVIHLSNVYDLEFEPDVVVAVVRPECGSILERGYLCIIPNTNTIYTSPTDNMISYITITCNDVKSILAQPKILRREAMGYPNSSYDKKSSMKRLCIFDRFLPVRVLDHSIRFVKPYKKIDSYR